MNAILGKFFGNFCEAKNFNFRKKEDVDHVTVLTCKATGTFFDQNDSGFKISEAHYTERVLWKDVENNVAVSIWAKGTVDQLNFRIYDNEADGQIDEVYLSDSQANAEDLFIIPPVHLVLKDGVWKTYGSEGRALRLSEEVLIGQIESGFRQALGF